MKVVDGLINAKKPKPPSPKPSPKDFVWPPQDHDDKIAEKFAASLQELLPARGWKHIDLAKALWGTQGAADSPRNTQACRRWVLAEHPIPNEETASYVAQVLDVSLARLLEPEGKFDPLPPMIRPRSDSPRFGGAGIKLKKKAKAAPKVDMRGKWKRKKTAATVAPKRKYVKRALNGHSLGDDGATWQLAEGVSPPDYTIHSSEDHKGHVEFNLKATLPLERAMSILHMLKTGEATE